MSVPAEVEASASGFAWVSDRCIELFRFRLRIWPSQANVHDIAFHDHWLIILKISLVVMSAKCRVRPSRTASVRFGSSDVTVSIPSASGPHLCAMALMQTVPHVHPYCLVSSRLRFFTQDAHARSTPSLGSILSSVYEDRFSSHKYTLWLPLSTMGRCRHRSSGQQRLRIHGRLPFA